MIKKFKTNNPYRPDQQILQEVNVSEKLEFDYSNSTWVSVDTEYLSFSPLLDQLCAIQVASSDPVDDTKQRVEIIYTYRKSADPKLKELMENENVMKIFHVFQADVPRIENFIESRIKGNLFDTQIAGRIALTNMQDHTMENLVNYLVDPMFKEMKKITIAEWDRNPEEWEEEQFQYAAEDVIYLNPVRIKLLEVAERRGKKELIEEIMNTLPAVAQVLKAGYNPNLFSI